MRVRMRRGKWTSALEKYKTSAVKWLLPVCACILSRFSHVRLSATLWTMACQAPLSWDSPGENTGVGCHFLLQGIFLTQGSNPRLLCLLHWHLGSPESKWFLKQSRREVCAMCFVTQ